MKINLDMKSCTGCHACAAVCPRGCISMIADDLGFLHPVIDENACIGCHRCEKICAETKVLPTHDEQEIYAAKHVSSEVKAKSASGGAFTAISDVILKNGGIIVGSVYGEDMAVFHTFARNEAERDRMRGSKYTYSLCGKEIFHEVKQLLDDGKCVMFTGTPCQNAALKATLGKDYENLFLVDILCHGICAPKIYADYLSSLAQTDRVIDINFRHSTENWHAPVTLVNYEKKGARQGNPENAYFKIFVQNRVLRESCYRCSYASFSRVSDITLGDFWGIENCHAEFDAPDGVSVITVNTPKGKELLMQVADLILLPCAPADCSHEQLNGLRERKRDETFLKEYREKGYQYVAKKYTYKSLSLRIREALYKIKFIKRLRDMIKRA